MARVWHLAPIAGTRTSTYSIQQGASVRSRKPNHLPRILWMAKYNVQKHAYAERNSKTLPQSRSARALFIGHELRDFRFRYCSIDFAFLHSSQSYFHILPNAAYHSLAAFPVTASNLHTHSPLLCCIALDIRCHNLSSSKI